MYPHPRFPMKGLDAPVAPTLMPVPGVLVRGFTAASIVICTPLWTPLQGPALVTSEREQCPWGLRGGKDLSQPQEQGCPQAVMTPVQTAVGFQMASGHPGNVFAPSGSSWFTGDQLGISPNFEKEGLLGNNRAMDVNPQEAGN